MIGTPNDKSDRSRLGSITSELVETEEIFLA